MMINDISEAGNGTLYAINASDYLFKLSGNNWQIVNSIQGKTVSATPYSTVYLTQELINLNANNVKKYYSSNNLTGCGFPSYERIF